MVAVLYSDANAEETIQQAMPYWLGILSILILNIVTIFAYKWSIASLVVCMGLWGMFSGLKDIINQPLQPFLLGTSLVAIPLYIAHRLYRGRRPPFVIDLLLCVPFLLGVEIIRAESPPGSLLIFGIGAYCLGAIAIKNLLLEKLTDSEKCT